MVINVKATSKKIKGYDALNQISGHYYDGVSSRIIHLAFNLQSVSFAVMMVPTTRQQWWGDNNICFLKLRCDYASVHFDTYGYCLPHLKEINIDEWNGELCVEIKGYATITCKRIVAKVETIAASSPDLPTVWKW